MLQMKYNLFDAISIVFVLISLFKIFLDIPRAIFIDKSLGKNCQFYNKFFIFIPNIQNNINYRRS